MWIEGKKVDNILTLFIMRTFSKMTHKPLHPDEVVMPLCWYERLKRKKRIIFQIDAILNIRFFYAIIFHSAARREILFILE